jgi:ER-bound oxygenase mpaB/B'/Rubber oxygenase, catalytic domain
MTPNFNPQFLESNRTIGDSVADRVVGQLLQVKGHVYLRELMPFLGDFKNCDFDDKDPILKEYFTQNAFLPTWADLNQIDKSCDLFKSYFIPIGMALGCYALPYCYLAADGAQVLNLSRRIKDDSTKRIMETADFVNGVLTKEDWHNGKNLIRILKVRLLHAMIRGFAKHSNQWKTEWGLPINQEDMAGTNLAFSYISIDGLKKMGYSINEAEQDAYIHTWAVIGNLQGIRKELLPLNFKQAEILDEQIARRLFKESAVGKDLMKALIAGLQAIKPYPFIKNLPIAQARILLGKQYASMLEIPRYPIEEGFIKMMNWMNSNYNAIKDFFRLRHNKFIQSVEMKLYEIIMANNRID